VSKTRCGQMAAFRYTWPGKEEAHACVDCALQVSAVADAISLPLQLIPLSYRVGELPSEFPTCSQMVSKEAA
jgi:hypothetical protein